MSNVHDSHDAHHQAQAESGDGIDQAKKNSIGEEAYNVKHNCALRGLFFIKRQATRVP